MENEILPPESGSPFHSGSADVLFQRIWTSVLGPTRERLKALPDPVTVAPAGAEVLLGRITAWAVQA